MKIKLTIVFVRVLLLYIVLLGSSCSNADNPAAAAPAKVGEAITFPSGLQYTILVAGTGAIALPGHPVTVNYTGKLTNGTVFDTSIGKDPFTFMLGSGQVILGWEMGVAGMKVGEKRKLVIPASLGYGAGGAEKIPPNSTLIFEVDLLEVK